MSIASNTYQVYHKLGKQYVILFYSIHSQEIVQGNQLGYKFLDTVVY